MKNNFTLLNCITLLIAFLFVDGVNAQQQLRLDSSFNVGTGFPNEGLEAPYSMELQPDGKILVCGNFLSFNGVACNRIVRLNPNGSVDASFNVGAGANDYVYKMALQPDGKILIGGLFTTFSGVSRKRVARLNSDGSLDTTFNPGNGISDPGVVNCFAIQPDGKILVGGFFYNFNNAAYQGLVRLQPNGNVDPSFTHSLPNESSVKVLALQPDGKILVGLQSGGVKRLNIDGNYDSTWTSPANSNINIYDFVLQTDGKIVVGGAFGSLGGNGYNYIARLNSNGSVDTSFNSGTGIKGTNSEVYCVALQQDGKILIGSHFDYYNLIERRKIARLNSNGTVDTGFVSLSPSFDYTVWDLAEDANGKTLVMGWFSGFNGQPSSGIARLCNTPKPQGQSQQTITTSVSPTLQDIQVTGTAIMWYDQNGNVLPENTMLVSGSTYHVTQTIGDCESLPLAVTVQIILGTDTFSEVKFSYYPNPVNEKLHLLSNHYIGKVELYNLSGQKIISQDINDLEGDVDMYNLPVGSYFVKAYPGDEVKNFMVLKN